MKANKFLILLTVLVGLLHSCNVDEDTPINTDANGKQVTGINDGNIIATDSVNFRMLLADSTSKRWITSAFTLSGSTIFTGCRLDDIMTIFSDGTYLYDGGQLCGAEDNQSMRNGNWELDYANLTIYFDKGTSDEYEAEVIGLEKNELRVKGSYMAMEVRGIYITN